MTVNIPTSATHENIPANAIKRESRGRVMMLSTALGVGGGAEEQVMLLSLGLKERGWDVKIVSLLPLASLWKELELSRIPVASLHMRRGIPDPRAMMRLHRELRDFRPQVLHCHMPQANLLGRSVRPFYPVPVLISTLHNMTMQRINGSSGRFLERAHGLTDHLSDLTTVICRPAIESYIKRRAVPASKIAVYYNGVNIGNYQADPLVRARMRRELEVDGAFVWLAVGRFELAKAFPTMIRAFANVVQRDSAPGMLLICGRGSLEQEIRAEVRACGIENRVRFLGVRRDIADVMNAADGFVMSSEMEGLPLVLLQASAIGMPIVATSVGGNAEVVLDGRSGYLVPSGNGHALADAMRWVQELPVAERAAMAEVGRAHVREQFDIQRILERWEQLYIDQIKLKSAA